GLVPARSTAGAAIAPTLGANLARCAEVHGESEHDPVGVVALRSAAVDAIAAQGERGPRAQLPGESDVVERLAVVGAFTQVALRVATGCSEVQSRAETARELNARAL